MYGGTIHDVVGRAFYVEGGTVTINGEIRNIKSDVDMWNGGRGVALHLRGGADGTVGGLIEEVNPDLQDSSVIYAENSSFELSESGIIRSCHNTGVVDREGALIYATPDKIQDKESGQITYFDFDLYGTITGCSVQTSLIYAVNTNLAFDIGPKASITGNTCKQLCYHNTAGNDLNIYGNVSGNTCKYSVFNGQNGGYNVTLYDGAKVNDNVVTGEGGVFNFGANRNIIMQEGSEICRNTVANGALITTFGEGNCFHMEGGTISGNTVENGGLFGFSSGSWKRCSVFELQGGTITDNTAPYNIIIATKGQKVPSIYSYLLVPENGFNEVYFVQDGKTVTVDANTKLGNANDNQGSYSQPDQKVESDPRSVAELNKAAEEYCGGNQVFATFWAQNEQGTAVTVNMDDKSVFAAEKYVYVLIQETDEKGAPAENAPVQLMAAKVDSNGEISFNLPGNALGYAVGLAQPSKDYGNMTLSAPAVLSDGNKQDGTYAIDYTTTYALSPDLKAAILANGGLNDICFQVNVDSKLNVDLSKVVMDSEVFETKEVRYESDGVFTVRCTLKDGWENAANSTTTIRFTGELNERDYVVGMKLSAVGSFSATIPLSDDSELVYVPSNLVVTELVSSVTITPADITIYTGGEGYTGVVDAVGNTTTVANGIPEPGYYITLPEEFNNELGGNANAADLSGILTLKYENGTVTRTWTFELYGTEEHSTNVANEERTRYIYRLNAGVDENGKDIPIRLKLTDPENPGEEIISDDQFTPNMAEQYKAYKMSVYSGGLDPQLIVAELELPSGKVVTCGVNSDAGNLVVRGLTGADTTTEILSDETALAGSTISVVAPDTGLNYYVNGSNVELADTTGVRLLVDQVLDKGVLASYIQSNMSETIPAGNYTYDQQYMDLVDTKNGNAYLTLGEDQSLDVYWKVPDGMDSGKAFYVVHFDGLDRNYDNLSAELEKNGPDVVPATLETVNGMQYIKFEAESFSPFVLVYEQKAGTVDPGDPTYPGSEDDDYTLHYVTNGGKHLSTETKSQSWTKDYEDLPVPVREGYTFEGWYWDLRLTDPVRGDVKVDKSMVTLYAKWSGDEKQPVDTGVSRWLDTVNHTAYLSGYPDGTFGTDRNMTRAEVAQMFYALLLDKDVEITTSFSDVPADAWYAKAVNTLSSLGMLGGYPDGTYRPDAPITRAEFAAVALAFARESASASCSYTDVSTNAWYYTYVAQASTYGWIGGYPDNTFRPDNQITRAEVCVIVNNMLSRAADQRYIDRNADELTSFADLTSNHWAYYTVMEATNSHKYSVDDGVESWSRVN